MQPVTYPGWQRSASEADDEGRGRRRLGSVGDYSSEAVDWDLDELDAIFTSSPDASPPREESPSPPERQDEEAEGSDQPDLSPIEDRQGW